MEALMAKELEVSFRTLLSKNEYIKLAEMFNDKPSNLQINYYFDTTRFTLKAAEVVLRVRKRDYYEVTLRRKKGYNKVEITNNISEEEFEKFVTEGIIPSLEIQAEIGELIKGQKIVNYMSLSTFRIFFPHKHGVLAIDKCEYLGETDYELEFQASTRDLGKKDFVETVKELGIIYKKGETKIKRAYNALKRQ
jgi:uncharacterized protein YjbK